jgi:hypothetical protein
MTHPHIDQFVDLIRPWTPAYSNSTFSFVALLHENELLIIAARLHLSPKTDRPRMQAVATPNLVAAEVPIAGNIDAVIAFVNTALTGSHLMVGEYVLRFLGDKTSGYSVYHDHASGPHRNWQRPAHLDSHSFEWCPPMGSNQQSADRTGARTSAPRLSWPRWLDA